MIGRIRRAIDRDGVFIFAVRQLDKGLRPLGVSLMSFTSHAGFRDNVVSGEMREQFDSIARHNLWNSSESISGAGSELKSTEIYRRKLSALIREAGFASMFDAPCGDLNWMSHVLSQVNIAYVGGDIAPSVIEANRKRFPDLEFVEFDITADVFPTADLWHCRDCFFHLSNELIWRALENFARSDCRYALLTTHSGVLRNVDMETGGWRYLDMTRKPFELPNPLRLLPDYRPGRDFPRHVGLWKAEQIREALAGRRG